MEGGDPLLAVEYEVIGVSAVRGGLDPGHGPETERHVLSVGLKEEQRPYVVTPQQRA